MSLLLAMSCFQSRSQGVALDALSAHLDSGLIDGIQLTPGNLPSPNFHKRVEQLAAGGVIVRFHQGFSWSHYRRHTLDDQLHPIDIDPERSIHAPRQTPRSVRDVGPFTTWADWQPTVLEYGLLVETMYPGYALGSGPELEMAMDAGVRLAVDIAHLSIQREAGVLSDETLERVLGYEQVCEVHVSHSRKGKDTHSPLQADTPLLDWARSKVGEVPVVVESYWHKSSLADQRQQLALLR